MERLIEDLKELPETADGERRDVFEKLGDNAAELENFRQAIDFYKEMVKCMFSLSVQIIHPKPTGLPFSTQMA